MSTTKNKTIHPYRDNPVSDYPLTDGELSVLAEHWWDVVFDHTIWWTLSGCVGGSEVREHNYALGRLDFLAANLGEEEISRIRDDAETRWKAALGEEQWTAFMNGRALYQEEAEERTRSRARQARKHRN